MQLTLKISENKTFKMLKVLLREQSELKIIYIKQETKTNEKIDVTELQLFNRRFYANPEKSGRIRKNAEESG